MDQIQNNNLLYNNYPYILQQNGNNINANTTINTVDTIQQVPYVTNVYNNVSGYVNYDQNPQIPKTDINQYYTPVIQYQSPIEQQYYIQRPFILVSPYAPLQTPITNTGNIPFIQNMFQQPTLNTGGDLTNIIAYKNTYPQLNFQGVNNLINTQPYMNSLMPLNQNPPVLYQKKINKIKPNTQSPTNFSTEKTKRFYKDTEYKSNKKAAVGLCFNTNYLLKLLSKCHITSPFKDIKSTYIEPYYYVYI